MTMQITKAVYEQLLRNNLPIIEHCQFIRGHKHDHIKSIVENSIEYYYDRRDQLRAADALAEAVRAWTDGNIGGGRYQDILDALAAYRKAAK
jgi:CO dehydrogenase/acetyl-CoA synthase beta subunit